MIRGPASYLGSNTIKPQLSEVEFVHKDINHANGIVLVNPVLQAFRKQRVLPAICPLNEALHPIPHSSARITAGESHVALRFHTARVKSRHEPLKP